MSLCPRSVRASVTSPAGFEKLRSHAGTSVFHLLGELLRETGMVLKALANLPAPVVSWADDAVFQGGYVRLFVSRASRRPVSGL